MSIGSTNAQRPFQPGETVEFCGERYRVLVNHGMSGRVQTLGESGYIVDPFYWNFKDEHAVRVHRSKD